MAVACAACAPAAIRPSSGLRRPGNRLNSRMPTIFPSLRYKDAPRAIEFLEQAFGFKRQMVVEGDNGTIAHAELAYGDGMVMLGTDRDDSHGSHVGHGWMYVVVEDADAHYAQAK